MERGAEEKEDLEKPLITKVNSSDDEGEKSKNNNNTAIAKPPSSLAISSPTSFSTEIDFERGSQRGSPFQSYFLSIPDDQLNNNYSSLTTLAPHSTNATDPFLGIVIQRIGQKTKASTNIALRALKKIPTTSSDLELVLFTALADGDKQVTLATIVLPGAQRILPEALQLLQTKNTGMSDVDRKETYEVFVNILSQTTLQFNAENKIKLQTVFEWMIQEKEEENFKKVMTETLYKQINREQLLMVSLHLRNWSAAQLIIQTKNIANIASAFLHVQQMDDSRSLIVNTDYESTRTILANDLSQNGIKDNSAHFVEKIDTDATIEKDNLHTALALIIQKDPHHRFSDVKIILSNPNNVNQVDLQKLLTAALTVGHGIAAIFLIGKGAKNIAQSLHFIQPNAIQRILRGWGVPDIVWAHDAYQKTYAALVAALQQPNYDFNVVGETKALQLVLHYMIENHENKEAKAILALDQIKNPDKTDRKEIGFLLATAVNANNNELVSILSALNPNNLASQLSRVQDNANRAPFFIFLFFYQRPTLAQSAQESLIQKLIADPISFLKNVEEKPYFIQLLKGMIQHTNATQRANALAILNKSEVFDYLDTDGTDTELNGLILCAFGGNNIHISKNIDALKILLLKNIKTNLGFILLMVEKTEELSQEKSVTTQVMQSFANNPIETTQAEYLLKIALLMISNGERDRARLLAFLDLLNTKQQINLLDLEQLLVTAIDKREGNLAIRLIELGAKNLFVALCMLLEMPLEEKTNTTWKDGTDYLTLLKNICQKIFLINHEISTLVNNIIDIDISFQAQTILQDSLTTNAEFLITEHPDPKINLVLNTENIFKQIKESLIVSVLLRGRLFLLQLLSESERNTVKKTKDITEFLKFLAVFYETAIKPNAVGNKDFDLYASGFYLILFNSENFNSLSAQTKPIFIKVLKLLMKIEIDLKFSSNNKLPQPAGDYTLLLQQNHIDKHLDVEDCLALLGTSIVDFKSFHFAKIFIDKITERQKKDQTLSNPTPFLEALSLVIPLVLGLSEEAKASSKSSASSSSSVSVKSNEEKIQNHLMSSLAGCALHTFNQPSVLLLLPSILSLLIKTKNEHKSAIFYKILQYFPTREISLDEKTTLSPHLYLINLIQCALLEYNPRMLYALLTKFNETQKPMTTDILRPSLDNAVQNKNYAVVDEILKITELQQYQQYNLPNTLLPLNATNLPLTAAENHDYQTLERLLGYIVSHQIKAEYDAVLATLIRNSEESASSELEKLTYIRIILNDTQNAKNLTLQSNLFNFDAGEDFEMIGLDDEPRDLLKICAEKGYFQIALLLVDHAFKNQKQADYKGTLHALQNKETRSPTLGWVYVPGSTEQSNTFPTPEDPKQTLQKKLQSILSATN